MFKVAGALAVCLLFFAAVVHAEDANAVHPTAEELQQMIADLKAEVAQARSQVITVQIDQSTQQLLQQLEGKMVAVEQKLSTIDERFLTLRNELSDKIDTSEKAVVGQVSADTSAKIDAAKTEIEDNTRLMTNPVRVNLPNFGLWMMVTAAFMLFAGLRRKSDIAAASKEAASQPQEKSAEAKEKLEALAKKKKELEEKQTEVDNLLKLSQILKEQQEKLAGEMKELAKHG